MDVNVFERISFNKIKELIETESIYNDILISDQINLPPSMEITYSRIEGIVFGYCMQGTATIQIDSKTVFIEHGDSLVIFPEQILDLKATSSDFKGFIYILSLTFLDQLSIDIQRLLPLVVSVKDNPVCRLSEEEGISFTDYFLMIKKKMALKSHPQQLKIIQNILEALIIEIGHVYKQKHSVELSKTNRKSTLFNQFMQDLGTYYKTERSVSFYASRLCITPKYLSSITKEMINKNPIELITQCVLVESKTMLKSTSLSIQQISDALNFPNQSFFGKYFKRYSGMSPQQYRQS